MRLPPFRCHQRDASYSVIALRSTKGAFQESKADVVTENATTNWAPVYPHLAYENPVQAISWLSKAFGFHERVRLDAPDGSFITAKLEPPEGGLIMITRRDQNFIDWLRRSVPELPEDAKLPYPHLGHSISVMVADVDAHFEQAKASGARLLSEPADQPWGLRVYAVLDLEGHQWEFVKPVREVEPEDWGAHRTS
jgi:uncharacterized glyoxalase superfamily protein PhnB